VPLGCNVQSRYYDPIIGRFLSIDPINFTPETPQMFGRYTYVNNDPVNLTDPTGMAPGDKFETMDETAKDFANYVDKLEKNDGRQKLERGADIQQDKKTGEFYYDDVQTGTKDKVDIKVSKSKAVGIIHSHPKDKSGGRNTRSVDRKNERLSPGDRKEVKSLNKALGKKLTSYVRTPSGKLKKYDGSNNYKKSGVEVERKD